MDSIVHVKNLAGWRVRARRRTWRRSVAVWLPHDTLHRIEGHWSVVVSKTGAGAPAACLRTRGDAAGGDSSAAGLGLEGAAADLERGHRRSSVGAGLRRSLARRFSLRAEHSGLRRERERQAERAGVAGMRAAKGAVVIPIHSIGTHVVPQWLAKCWDPLHGERLLIRIAQRDLPNRLKNASYLQIVDALEPAYLVGDGPLRKKQEVGLVAFLRSASWLYLIAWSFNLSVLLVGVLIFLYSILIVFQDDDADTNFIGAFVSTCVFGIALTIICTEILAAALCAALPFRSKWTYMPARLLFMGLAFALSMNGLTQLGFNYDGDGVQLQELDAGTVGSNATSG
jgi:hypothetical protein